MQSAKRSEPIQATEDELVGALDALEVPYLTGGVQDDVARALAPDALLEGLARASDARVRSALIPLLLRHPEFAAEAKRAAARLNDKSEARATLECFYTAAMLLQKKYAARLRNLFGPQPTLPNLFGENLAVAITADVDAALTRLGARNAELRGLALNWVETYDHAARTWIEYVEWRAQREAKQWQVN